MRRFSYLEPKTVEEASALLGEHGKKAALLAGGTDLLVRMKDGKESADVLISLEGVAGLDELHMDAQGGLSLGATVTLARAGSHPAIGRSFAVLAHSCRQVGSQQIRNRATVGGNLCNASPAADLAPALLAYGAQAQIFGAGGRRLIPLPDFFLGPGETVLREGEVLERLLIPPPPATGVYLKHTVRKAMDLAIIGVAALIHLEEGICRKARVALGAVAPTPRRVFALESFLEGRRLTDEVLEEGGRLALQVIEPISDIRASAEYRREMVRVLTVRALRQASRQASGRKG